MDIDQYVATARKKYDDLAGIYGPQGRVGGPAVTDPLVPKLPKAYSNVVGKVNAAPSQGDLYALIYGDPGYQTAKAGADLSLSNAAAQRRAALRQLVLNYGGMGGLQDPYGDVDQATLDAASNNPYSQLKQLSRNYDQSVEAFKRQLAARGALQSGDLGYGIGQLDYGRGQSEYDLGQQMLSGAQGAVNTYKGTESGYYNTLAQAIRDAAASVAQWWTPSSAADSGEASDIGSLGGDNNPYASHTPVQLGTVTVPDPNGGPGTVDIPHFYEGDLPQIQYDGAPWYRDPNTGELYQLQGGAGSFKAKLA